MTTVIRQPDVLDSLAQLPEDVRALEFAMVARMMEMLRKPGWIAQAMLGDLAVTDRAVNDVAAGKVTGQLTSAQILSLAASKITGTVVNSQINDVAASKVTGQLVSTQIGAAQVGSGQIADGSATWWHYTTATTADPAMTGGGPVPNMSMTANFGGNPLIVLFTGTVFGTSGSIVTFAINDGTIDHGDSFRQVSLPPGQWLDVTTICPMQPAAGARTISVNAGVQAPGTAKWNGVQRNLVILEHRR